MSENPKTVREQVTSKIRNELVAGRFEAGTMLREVEFAKRFGVSRGPVRDAFIQLSHEGFLAYHANRGVMVREAPNSTDRPFIISLRNQIETHIVCNGLEAVTDESVELLGKALIKLGEACKTGEATEVALRDLEFHETMLVACQGEDLIGAWRQLCTRMLMTYTRLNNYDEVFKEHQRIFGAVESRNVEEAISAIKANVL